MKKIFTLSFLLIGFVSFAQKAAETKQVTTNDSQTKQEPVANNPRVAATSTQTRTSEPTKLPYDVNDAYMGRKQEFLGNLTVLSLPNDFPKYEKIWSLKEYNQVVDAFYYNHMDIVKESVRAKLEQLKH